MLIVGCGRLPEIEKDAWRAFLLAGVYSLKEERNAV